MSIGVAAYKYLKSIPNQTLTDEQKKAVLEYENRHSELITEEQKQNTIEYSKKICQSSELVYPEISREVLWSRFQYFYKQDNNRDFEQTKESVVAITTIAYYFMRNEKFFDQPNVSNLSEPSFDKGLLCIGGYGVGKTSILKAIQKALQCYGVSYAIRNMNDIVSDYEDCKEAHDRKTFWHSITRGNCLFDDVKTEREASNFGKVNLFKDIIEKRYMLKESVTHITCNYHNDYPNDLSAGLDEFGTIYGGRAYDRLFEMCNIIEFKGNSFRK